MEILQSSQQLPGSFFSFLFFSLLSFCLNVGFFCVMRVATWLDAATMVVGFAKMTDYCEPRLACVSHNSLKLGEDRFCLSFTISKGSLRPSVVETDSSAVFRKQDLSCDMVT